MLVLHCHPSARPSYLEVGSSMLSIPCLLVLAECQRYQKVLIEFICELNSAGVSSVPWGQSLEQKRPITWKKIPRIGVQPLQGCVAWTGHLTSPVALFLICEMTEIILPTSPSTCEDWIGKHKHTYYDSYDMFPQITTAYRRWRVISHKTVLTRPDVAGPSVV